MKADLLNEKKEKIGQIELPEQFFGVKWNSDLVHQALVSQLANRRDPIAHAKTRAEVRGGGKKPWRQKGTGRARHGSTRSPIWVGGGVTHGPRNDKSYAKKINRRMNRLAISAVLSKKLKDNEIVFVSGFEDPQAKAKYWAGVLKNLSDMRSKTALVFKNSNKKFARAVANIRNADTFGPGSLNVHDLLRHKTIIFEQGAVEELTASKK